MCIESDQPGRALGEGWKEGTKMQFWVGPWNLIRHITCVQVQKNWEEIVGNFNFKWTSQGPCTEKIEPHLVIEGNRKSGTESVLLRVREGILSVRVLYDDEERGNDLQVRMSVGVKD